MKKSFKVFFLDIGVRNALIDIEREIPERSDKGHIFENFFITEKIKDGNNLHIFPPELMFWRTRQGLEIDLVEKNGVELNAYECKWSRDEKYSFSTFLKFYTNAKTNIVNPENLI